MNGSAENGTPAHNADVFEDCHGEDDEAMIVNHIRTLSDPASPSFSIVCPVVTRF
jgi:hypothetical protein